MPSWGELIDETIPHKNDRNEDVMGISIDELRKKYLSKMNEYTERNVIAYYSGWLNHRTNNTDINDSDITGFMNAIKGMDCDKGLDLILHTPGGSPTACEGIVNYLHSKFNDDIRVIVPHMAMSAGTMLSCAAKEIVMGKHSYLGPIDPQYGSVSAYNILNEFQQAQIDLKSDNSSKAFWELQLKKYPAAFMYTIIDAIKLSGELVVDWLNRYMFKDLEDSEKIKKTEAIVKQLNTNNRSHARHFSCEFCKQLGLNIYELETNQQFQELVLSVHHSYVITFNSSTVSKIIENHCGKRYVIHEG